MTHRQASSPPCSAGPVAARRPPARHPAARPQTLAQAGQTPEHLRRLVMSCCSWRDLLQLRREHPECFEAVAPLVLDTGTGEGGVAEQLADTVATRGTSGPQ